MKYLLLSLIMLLSLLFFPVQSTDGEAVYSSEYVIKNKIKSTESTIEKRISKVPVERKKAKTKKRKRGKITKKLKRQQMQDKRNAWTIAGAILGFIFLWSGILFLPIIFLALLLGINPLLFFSIPVFLIISGITLLNSSFNSSSRAFQRNPDYERKRKRNFGIATIITGGASIISSLAFSLIAIQGIIVAVFNVSIIAIPILGIFIGIFLLLSGIMKIDKSYGTYSDNPVVERKRIKKQMIYGFIGFIIFAITALVLFLFGLWIIALSFAASAFGMIINALMKYSQLRTKSNQ